MRDEHDLARERESYSRSDIRRDDQKLRQYVAQLDDETLDLLEYEIEYETFQPIRSRPKERRKGRS